jgi:hypothetical protein
MIETFRAIDIDNTDDLKLTKKIYKLLWRVFGLNGCSPIFKLI